jgi:hypothetical protein
MAKIHHIRSIKPGIDLDRIFLHMFSRKVYKDSTFTLMGTLFEAPAILSGKSINIHFDPHPPVSRVLISQGGREYGEARVVDTYANSKVKRSYCSGRNVDIDDEDPQLPVNLLATSMGGF